MIVKISYNQYQCQKVETRRLARLYHSKCWQKIPMVLHHFRHFGTGITIINRVLLKFLGSLKSVNLMAKIA